MEDLAGRIDEHVITSDVLRHNPLGDPHERQLFVYTPPGYDEDLDRRYPSIYLIQGYTGQVEMWRHPFPWRGSVPAAIDARMADGSCPPAVIVYVDAWTRFGGSQFVDSPGTGRYHTYLCEEVVPFVDARYRTLADRDHRGIQGKSSGGFGAMITPMLRPDLFGGFATHAGDALYEACYVKGFAEAARALREHYDGSYDRFLDDFFDRPGMTKPDDGNLIMTYGVAACFSAEDDGTVRLPFEVATGRLVDDVWQRWLDWDPVRMVAGHADALRSQRAIWIDAGRKDDWFLDLGAEAFRRELESIDVTDYHFELFEATHSGIDYRYPLSVAYLAERLSP